MQIFWFDEKAKGNALFISPKALKISLVDDRQD